jgi:quinol monooxygenase YgiN
MSNVYVSITGLRIKKPWHFFSFLWHTRRSLRQARTTPGNLQATVRRINGVFHTLSAWESENAMRRFLYTGAHKDAIRAFPTVATGKTFGFTTDHVPSWSEVHALWRERAREYGT